MRRQRCVRAIRPEPVGFSANERSRSGSLNRFAYPSLDFGQTVPPAALPELSADDSFAPKATVLDTGAGGADDCDLENEAAQKQALIVKCHELVVGVAQLPVCLIAFAALRHLPGALLDAHSNVRLSRRYRSTPKRIAAGRITSESITTRGPHDQAGGSTARRQRS
jgi:hypothetical protein